MTAEILKMIYNMDNIFKSPFRAFGRAGRIWVMRRPDAVGASDAGKP
jgi:hypothetical protein